MSEYHPRDGVSQLNKLMSGADPVDDRRMSPPVDPVRQRRRRRRGAIITGIVALLVGAMAGSYVFLTLTAPVGSAASTTVRPPVTVPAAVSYALPSNGEMAISVSGAEDYMGKPTDGILTSSGGNGALPMASISKLITALAILNAKPLSSSADGASAGGPTITFTKADHALYDKYYLLGATITAMPTGSSMSEYNALQAMLVVSACNYADAISTWAFGSPGAFLGATKKWLTAHGMTSTTMVEPTGIDPHNVSTPTDLIALGKIAASDPTIASIVSKTHLDVPGLDPMPNTNDLLGTDGITGIKTGTLDPGGSDLLFSASIGVGTPNKLSMVGVVLGDDDKTSEDAAVTHLIESITAGFHDVPLGSNGQEVGTYTTPWGSNATMVLGANAQVVTWSNTPVSSTMTTTTLKTGRSGSKVGSITWTAGTTKVTVPIVLKGSITPPTAQWRMTHPGELLKLNSAG